MFGDNIAIAHPLEPNWIAMDIGAICYAVRSIVRYTSSQCEKPNKPGPGHLTMPKATSTNGRTTHAHDRRNRPRFVDRQVHDMRNNRLPAAVYVAVSPDDIRVIGAVNNNGTSNDTRRMRTTRKVRGKVANVWKPAPASITTTTGFCRRCE
jgi:hypothetical protein